MSRRALAAALLLLLAPALAAAQTAIRPDQICPGGVCATPDITWGPGGGGYQIGTTVPWRTISGTTILATDFLTTDSGRIIELTNALAITATLPDTGTAGFGDGFGFTIQVKSGTLTLNKTGTTNKINGLDQIKVGSYQSVGLVSKGGIWYATYSLPQPLTQTGSKILADNMTWQTGGTAPPAAVALNAHGVGTSGATGATSNTVTITGVGPGEVITVFWLYCIDATCTTSGGPAVLASSVSGTRGETCTLIPGAALFATGAGIRGGVGASFCSGTTGATASDTITVTVASAVNYLQVWAMSWTNAANTLDTACTGTAAFGTSGGTTSVTIPTAANTTIANDVVVGFVFPATSASITGTGGTVIVDGASGNPQQSTMYKPATTTGAYSLTATLGVNNTWVGNVICIHP